MARVALKDKPISGPYPQLAVLIREILGDMSARVAQRRTGVNFFTISNMAQGDRGSYQSIVKFAQGFGRDPNPLLQAADLPLLNQDVIIAEGMTVRLMRGSGPTEPILLTGALIEDWFNCAELKRPAGE